MNNLGSRFILTLYAVVVCFIVGSCAGGGQHIRTKLIEDDQEISGRFTVILYKTVAYQGLEAIVILDSEDDRFTMLPYTPSYNYTVLSGIGGRIAMAKGIGFLSRHFAYSDFETRKILDEGGGIIGYELRPLYSTGSYSSIDVLDVGYSLMEGGLVRVRIGLDSSIDQVFK